MFKFIGSPGLCLCLALASGLAGAAEFDWPNWRGPSHNGVSQESGWLTQWPAAGPTQLWKASVGIGFSSFAVVGTRVLTMGHAEGKDTVVCFNGRTGELLWKQSYAAELDARLYEGGPNATPAVDGQRVYTLGRQGQVNCLHLDNGQVVWSRDLMKEFGLTEPGKDWWGFSGSPLVEGRLVYFNAGTHGIALEKDTGRTAWASGQDAASYASPVAFDSGTTRAVAVFGAKSLHAMDARTGRKLWELPWKTSYDINAADPIFADGHLFVSSGYRSGGALYKLEGSEPKLIWKSAEMHNQMNPSVLHGKHLYGISGQNGHLGELRCVEFLTGKVVWKEPAAGMGSVIIADGRLVVLTEKGELITAPATPEGFNPTGRAQVLGGRCWTSPVLSHGLIYCRNAKGDMVCLDVRGGGSSSIQTTKP